MTSEQLCREEFEKWIGSNLTRDENGRYTYFFTLTAWGIFQRAWGASSTVWAPRFEAAYREGYVRGFDLLIIEQDAYWNDSDSKRWLDEFTS